MTTCFPCGSPSFSVTSLSAPLRTFVHTTSWKSSKKVWKRFMAPSSGYAMTTSSASGRSFSCSSSRGMPVSKHGVMLSPK